MRPTCFWVGQNGEAELVVKLGSAALKYREAQRYKADILIATALALCSLASDAFAAPDQVS